MLYMGSRLRFFKWLDMALLLHTRNALHIVSWISKVKTLNQEPYFCFAVLTNFVCSDACNVRATSST